MSEKYKPGEKPKDSAQFVEKNRQGNKVNTLEVTGIEGKPLPPTSKPGHHWEPIDKTKHK